jgi:hypothetical protein
MSNAWKITAANLVGAQAVDETSTVQRHPLGTVITGSSDTLGGAEFIYLQGVGSTVVGSVVNYDAVFVTALNTTGLSTPRPLAVAMSANVANQFGWYQISGIATVVKANTSVFGCRFVHCHVRWCSDRRCLRSDRERRCRGRCCFGSHGVDVGSRDDQPSDRSFGRFVSLTGRGATPALSL